MPYLLYKANVIYSVTDGVTEIQNIYGLLIKVLRLSINLYLLQFLQIMEAEVQLHS